MGWISEGKDIIGMAPYLSAYMGHTEFTMTLYYIHLLPERLVNCAGIDWERFSRIYPEVTYEKD
jgi:integrase